MVLLYSQGGEWGGGGGWLVWVCPVGVVMWMLLSGCGWWFQPGVCLVWLQFSRGLGRW